MWCVVKLPLYQLFLLTPIWVIYLVVKYRQWHHNHRHEFTPVIFTMKQNEQNASWQLTNGALYHFVEACRNLHQPLLVIDEHLAHCFANSFCEFDPQKSNIQFGVSATYADEAFAKIKRTRCFHCKMRRYSACIAFQYKQTTIFLRIVQESKKAWIFGQCAGLPKMALLPQNVSDVLFNNVRYLTSSAVQKYQEQIKYSTLIDCKQISVNHKGGQAQLAPLISKRQFAQLVYVRNLLYNHNTTPILFGGTTLGWYRECDIIFDTHDFDICLPINQYSESLERALTSDKQLQLFLKIGMVNDSLELSFHSHGVKIDLFFLYEEASYSWAGGLDFNTFEKLKWIYPKLGNHVCTAALKEELFYVPCNVHDFLLADYGQNWTSKVPNYRFVKSDLHYNVQRGENVQNTSWYRVYTHSLSKLSRGHVSSI